MLKQTLLRELEKLPRTAQNSIRENFSEDGWNLFVQIVGYVISKPAAQRPTLPSLSRFIEEKTGVHVKRTSLRDYIRRTEDEQQRQKSKNRVGKGS